jgi:ATP-binding cassette subfamily A (ABC1) protein 3
VFILDNDKKHKVAVDNLSVAIEKGEVFGLLGVNGAGKTTTFKMLAGEITSTSGDSYFTGMKISENLSKVRQNLGYCPQFDALIENLTVREQLELFYDLKSLPSEYKDAVITQKIKEMNLEEYEDKLSGTLSGGNKRKLSVAMAMVGNPNIIFLDEPSTGMDPKARRFMWKIISRIASEKKQSTIILTTHSMEEAEALSTKLGIMVNGNFKCIGTPQHIKSKYGEGYEIEIKVVPCSKEQIMQYMVQQKLEHKVVVEEKELSGFLNYLKVEPATQAEISAKGSGNYIHNQITSTKKIETFQIVEYLLLVNKVKVIKQFMEMKFGGCEVIESFQTFIRFKVKANLSVGKMFEVLETEKGKLEIDSYSIKQATVEQIFNRFAEDG